MIATITLNPSIDQLITVRGLVKDDANRALSIHRFPGGKGMNVSKVVMELGVRTRAHALVGGFAGELWKDLVRELGVPLKAVAVAGETRINTVLTDVKDRTQTRVSAPGPRVTAREFSAFRRTLVRGRFKPFLWALGGSLPPGLPEGAYGDLIRWLQGRGIPCILDTDNEALKLGLRAKPFMIKPNEYEMSRLVGRSLSTEREYVRAAAELVAQGVRIVCVSLGARGALLVTAEERFHVSTPKIKPKSKVGAGDSLIGGFAVGLFRKQGLREAARLGVAASTSAVMSGGVRLCCARDLSRLLSRIRVRSL